MLAAPPSRVSRVMVSPDGTLGCLTNPREITTVRLPSLEREAEIGVDQDVGVAVIGTPPLIVVLTPAGLLHVVDPRGADGPHKVGELAIEAGAQIAAVTSDHLFARTSSGTFIITVSPRPQATQLSIRAQVSAVGTCPSPDQFILCAGGVLEEWSVELRAPLRRFRLAKPVGARHVGGNMRHLWFVAETAPAEIVLVPLASARPERIELPEPAANVVAERSGNQLAVVGGKTGAVYVVNLADRGPVSVRTIHPGPVDDLAWIGADSLLTATQSVLELVTIATSSPVTARPASEPEAASEPKPKWQPLSTFERLAQWKAQARERAESSAAEPSATAAPRGPAAAPDPTVAAAPTAPILAASSAPVSVTPAPALESVTPLYEWRDALALWARRWLGGGRGEAPLLAACPLHDVSSRLGLGADESLVLWLLYGARLCGSDGVAPIDVAAIAPQRWNDALGHTHLRTTGAFRWRRNRIDLAREVTDALDEAAPRFGTIVDSPMPLQPSIAVVAAEADLFAIARRVSPRLGRLLVPNERGLRSPSRFLVEARIRDLAPVILATRATAPIPEHAVVIVESEAAAGQLGLAVMSDIERVRELA